MLIIILFFLGLIVGSFINALVWRYENNISMKGRSICPKCKEQIRATDNIPILSYLILRGKCRHCKKPISPQYPMVEITTALLFSTVGYFTRPGHVISGWLTGNYGSLQSLAPGKLILVNLALLLIILLVIALLVIISVYDYRTKEIPNSFNVALVVLSAIYLITSIVAQHNTFDPIRYIFTGAVAFIFFYSFVFFSRETWMGGGDAKMAFGMGILLGPIYTFLAIVIASVSGSVYGIAAIAQEKKAVTIKKSRNKKTSPEHIGHQIPFGPFLAFGTYVALVFGNQIIAWYVKIFLDL